MCVTCGCGMGAGAKLSLHGNNKAHVHVHAEGTRHTHEPIAKQTQRGGMRYRAIQADTHDHTHEYTHSHQHGDNLSVPGRDTHTLQLEAQILGKNQLIAERNRGWLTERGILALNLMSSPGAGKTTLLERTIQDLLVSMPITVVEGDQETANDAERIRATGARAVQVNTGTGCHLEADMLERAMTLLNPEPGSLLMIENVGNLVCPALFDLGERAKVVIFSVTEGEDKPLKYPHMFGAAEVMLLSKIDLIPHLRFNLALAIENARTVNPDLKIFPVSAYSGEGLEVWYDWLRSELAANAATPTMQARHEIHTART